MNPGLYFRKHGDNASLHRVIKFQLNNGDPITKVEHLLGPATRNKSPQYREICKRLARQDPKGWPEGFQENDELLGYSTRSMTIHLQARDGRLVNFRPTDFEDLVSFQLLGR